MLAGLAGVAIPVVIHMLNRRRVTVIDWGAMQFLELGKRARLKFQLSELLLLAARMALLAIVVLALARPFWIANEPESRAAETVSRFFGWCSTGPAAWDARPEKPLSENKRSCGPGGLSPASAREIQSPSWSRKTG
jgi:hypothetical protein